jgi:predicted nucleic acid-binding protein
MARCVHRTNIYLVDEQITRLDRRAQAEGLARAELIRRLLDRLLDSEADRLGADVAAIDASFGLLADLGIELDRGNGARGAHLERIANFVILVDSDVLIAHLRGAEAARDWLLDARRRTGPLAVSVVSLAEIAGGMRSGERHEVVRLLGSLQPVPVGQVVAWRAGELRRTYRRSQAAIGTADHLIAASAEVHGYELATLSVKHFPMFDDIAPPFPS